MKLTLKNSISLIYFFAIFTSSFSSFSFAKDSQEDMIKKGKTIYMSNCIVCHNIDPHKNGSLGPGLSGSSLELVRLRVLETKYPVGYTPKRKTKLMKPFPKLKSRKAFGNFVDKTDLGEYLDSKDLKPFNIRLKNQDRLISLRVSSDLLTLLKKAAVRHRTKYQRLIKSILEENIGHYLP